MEFIIESITNPGEGNIKKYQHYLSRTSPHVNMPSNIMHGQHIMYRRLPHIPSQQSLAHSAHKSLLPIANKQAHNTTIMNIIPAITPTAIPTASPTLVPGVPLSVNAYVCM